MAVAPDEVLPPASVPIIVFEKPEPTVVKLCPALLPIHTLLKLVVIATPALYPIKMLSAPVVRLVPVSPPLKTTFCAPVTEAGTKPA